MNTERITGDLVGPTWPMPIQDLRDLVLDTGGQLTLLDTETGDLFDVGDFDTFTEVRVTIADQPVAIVRPLPDGTLQCRPTLEVASP